MCSIVAFIDLGSFSSFTFKKVQHILCGTPTYAKSYKWLPAPSSSFAALNHEIIDIASLNVRLIL